MAFTLLSWDHMRAIVILASCCCLAACNSGSIDAASSLPDASVIKLPPGTKPGADTAPGCAGIPVSGVCQQGVAVYCDAADDVVRRVECTELGQECVIDPNSGARCTSIDTGGTRVPGMPCGGVVDVVGVCTADGTAVWCDVESDQIVSWSCVQNQRECMVDDCAFGAYCCQGGGTSSPANECESLGFYGECAGTTARYCSGSDTLIEIDCAVQGNACALDICAEGAYCCTQDDYAAACQAMGTQGRCGGPDNNTVLRCDGAGLIQRMDCGSTGGTCVVDQCGQGAQCC